jgi:uncharacterized protein (DUF2235 family)
VQQAYRYLVSTYEPSDQLFFFGFGRGAFTVRSLAGLIRNCGILRRDAEEMLKLGYELYRTRSPGSLPRSEEAMLFRRTYAISDIAPINFIGVWDTVGTLGNPLMLNGYITRQQAFHDTNLSSTVANAYHALAIDEKRKNFQATLWNQQTHAENQTLEQVWFAGVHSNLGGGYATTGLSDIVLQWMVEKARDCRLELEEIPARPDPNKGPTNEHLHPSVLTRYRADFSYRPKNLEDYFRRNLHMLPA